MSASSDKPHLKYESVDAWMKGENVPPQFFKIADDQLRKTYVTQYGELRRHLFAKHLATLTAEEQAQFERGDHPSQRHEFADRAQPIAEEFQRELRRMSVIARVNLGWGQCDQIVLLVNLVTKPEPGVRDRLPWLFRGFVVKYFWEDDSQD